MALQTEEELRALATGLSASADAFNEALKKAVAAHQVAPAEVFRHLGTEQSLRAIANELYFEATRRTIEGLDTASAELDEGLADAQAVIRRITTFKSALELFSGLVVFAAAVSAGKIPAVKTSFTELRKTTEKCRIALAADVQQVGKS